MIPIPDAARLWRETTNRIAREAAARVAAAWLSYAAGDIALEECVGIQATLIAAAQRRATTANDVIFAAELTEKLGTAFEVLGLSWREEADTQTARLARAAASVIGEEPAYVEAAARAVTREQVKQLQAESVRRRLDRLTSSETIGASSWARETAGEVWQERGVVTGWYRRLSPGACDRCRALQGRGPEDKYIHPVQHKFARRHPRCTCFQGFWTGELEPWQVWVGPKGQLRTIPGGDGVGRVDRRPETARTPVNGAY